MGTTGKVVFEVAPLAMQSEGTWIRCRAKIRQDHVPVINVDLCGAVPDVFLRHHLDAIRMDAQAALI